MSSFASIALERGFLFGRVLARDVLARNGLEFVTASKAFCSAFPDGDIVGVITSLDETIADLHRLSPRERSTNRCHTLSSGEQQMLATGRALALNGTPLLLDEPTEGLAPLMVAELERILRELKQMGASMLLVAQNVHFAMRLADVVCIMRKGRIVHTGNTQEAGRNTEVMHLYLGV